jgi:hypothetical protein
VELAVDKAIQRITRAIAEQRCVLFLGAGIHTAPPEGSLFAYPDEQRPPSGGALSRMLAQECGWHGRFPGEDPSNLQRVSLFFERSQGRDNLVRAVREAVHVGKRPSPLLGGFVNDREKSPLSIMEIPHPAAVWFGRRAGARSRVGLVVRSSRLR